MVTGSKKRSSIGSIYNDRSIRVKILASFLVIFALIVFQFYSSQNSLTELHDTFNEGTESLSVAYESRGQNAAIKDSVQKINELMRIEQVRFVQYREWTTKSIAAHETNQIDISTEAGTVSDLIVNLPDYIQKTDGQIRLNTLVSNIGEFSTHLDLGYKLLPDKIANDIKQGLQEYGFQLSLQVNQILTWIYTNNTELLTNATLERNDLLLPIAESINDMGERANTFNDLNTFAPYEEKYELLHNELQEIYQMTINNSKFLNETINVNAGNMSAIDFNLVNPVIQNLMGNVTFVNELVDNETIILDNGIAELTHHGNMAIAVLNQQFSPSFTAMVAWTDSVDVSLQEAFEQAEAKVDKDVEDITADQEFLLLTILLASFVIIIFVQFAINYQITKPLVTISKWSEQISKGDLSTTPSNEPMRRLDEIGRLHNNFWGMNIFLRNIIKAVRESSELITDTADDLSANTSEINSTAEEVSAIAQSMAKGSTTQAEVITDIVQELQLTSEIVDNVINQINYNLRIIHDLSEQTNVLALNTAIEAANAGEFGRGFGVISESIRKMAVQSKKTTSEVTKDSSDILVQLRHTFSSISQKIENVASVSEETAASAEEVAASAEELTAIIEEIAARAASLTDRSHGFGGLVNRFRLSPKFDQSGKIMSMDHEMEETKKTDTTSHSKTVDLSEEKSKEMKDNLDMDSKMVSKTFDKNIPSNQEEESLKKLQGVDLDEILEDDENESE